MSWSPKRGDLVRLNGSKKSSPIGLVVSVDLIKGVYKDSSGLEPCMTCLVWWSDVPKTLRWGKEEVSSLTEVPDGLLERV